MKNFYLKIISFWFVLLITALINATIREIGYKPLLTPYLGIWVHQISSLTGILFFYLAIYIFLKKSKTKYASKDLFLASFIWILLTLIFETFMNLYLRHLTFAQVLETYYFWRGETWIFVLLSLIISPQIIRKKLSAPSSK